MTTICPQLSQCVSCSHAQELHSSAADTMAANASSPTGMMDLQVKQGLRMAIEPHGGHFWSTQGQIQRPMDITSLRIDNQVRLC